MLQRGSARRWTAVSLLAVLVLLVWGPSAVPHSTSVYTAPVQLTLTTRFIDISAYGFDGELRIVIMSPYWNELYVLGDGWFRGDLSADLLGLDQHGNIPTGEILGMWTEYCDDCSSDIELQGQGEIWETIPILCDLEGPLSVYVAFDGRIGRISITSSNSRRLHIVEDTEVDVVNGSLLVTITVRVTGDLPIEIVKSSATAGLAYNTQWVPEALTHFYTQDLGNGTLQPGDEFTVELPLPPVPEDVLAYFERALANVYTDIPNDDLEYDYIGITLRFEDEGGERLKATTHIPFNVRWDESGTFFYVEIGLAHPQEDS